MIRHFINVFYIINEFSQDKGKAFIGLFFLLTLNLLSICWLFGIDVLGALFTGKYALDRWVMLPMVTAPILVIIFVYYRFNKFKVEEIFKILNADERSRKKVKKKVILYIVLSVLFSISVIFIPSINY